MSPRLGPAPGIVEPARAALVATLRKLTGGSRFDTLDELSDHIAGRPGKRRLSELARGTGKFPEQDGSARTENDVRRALTGDDRWHLRRIDDVLPGRPRRPEDCVVTYLDGARCRCGVSP